MAQVVDKMRAADVIVLATPVYFYTMNAQLKTMIDRFYARNAALAEKHMKAAVIATAWDDNETVMKAFAAHMEALFDYLQFERCGMLLARGAGTVEMMPQRYRQKAYDMGRRL